MSVAAVAAMLDWVNTRPGLTGTGNPLVQGAYPEAVRSPADGAYAVLSRFQETPAALSVAEGSDLATAHIDGLVYAGTVEAAEAAAVALRSAWETLTGIPEPCGESGTHVLVSDNCFGPVFVPQAGDSGENYCFQVGADFVLTQ